MTPELKSKILQYEKSQSIDFTPEQLQEFKRYCQTTFRFSIDTSCNSCVCEHVKKTILYLKNER